MTEGALNTFKTLIRKMERGISNIMGEPVQFWVQE